jgi:hypothetical protein
MTLETLELEALAAAEQDARFVVDAWEAPIREWLGERTDVSIAEVLEALRLSSRDQSAQTRVSKIVTHLGFSWHRPRTPEGRRTQRYWRDPVLAKSLATKG